MSDDAWEALADPFVDGAYATVKGQVRTYVLHQQLLAHMREPPATVLDVGGGAAHQSLPLARLGFDVTILDPSATMLAKAEQRLSGEPRAVRRRVRLVEGAGESAAEVIGGEQFDTVLCHGVLMYLNRPEPMVRTLCHCTAPGGVVSIMALNALTLAIRPALDRRWSDWLDLPLAATDVAAVADVELHASRRDPYRQLSRVFHLVGRRTDQAPGEDGHRPLGALGAGP